MQIFKVTILRSLIEKYRFNALNRNSSHKFNRLLFAIIFIGFLSVSWICKIQNLLKQIKIANIVQSNFKNIVLKYFFFQFSSNYSERFVHYTRMCLFVKCVPNDSTFVNVLVVFYRNFFKVSILLLSIDLRHYIRNVYPLKPCICKWPKQILINI